MLKAIFSILCVLFAPELHAEAVGDLCFEKSPIFDQIADLVGHFNRCNRGGYCSQDQGFSNLWAQHEVMAEQIQRLTGEWVGFASTRMGVVDTGFDRDQENLMKGKFRPWVQTPIPLPESQKNPGTDEGGHGTSIIGLLEGNYGVGIYPTKRTSVYKVPMKTNMRYSAADIDRLSNQACLDGNQIVIMSWSDHLHHGGESVEDRFKKKGYDDNFRENGCILVKTAGNDGLTSRTSRTDSLDYVHRVDALAPNSYMADFSNFGELSVPGESVFSFLSNDQAEGRAPNCRLDNGVEGALVNGTSFAGPIYGDILQAVMDVLGEDAYRGRQPYTNEEKRKLRDLATIIMHEARIGRGINGLRAIFLARGWKGWLSRDLPSFERNQYGKVKRRHKTELVQAMENSPELKEYCNSIPPENPRETFRDPHCGKKSYNDICELHECSESLRERIAVCPNAGVSEIAQLYRIYHKIGDANAMNRLSNMAGRFEMKDLVPEFANEYLRLRRSSDPEFPSNEEQRKEFVSHVIRVVSGSHTFTRSISDIGDGYLAAANIPNQNDPHGVFDQIKYELFSDLNLLRGDPRTNREILNVILKTPGEHPFMFGTGVQEFLFPQSSRDALTTSQEERAQLIQVMVARKMIPKKDIRSRFWPSDFPERQNEVDSILRKAVHAQDWEFFEELKSNPYYSDVVFPFRMRDQLGQLWDMAEDPSLTEQERERRAEIVRQYVPSEN